MRDARDGLPERGHLLGLQQLVVQVARLILELLAAADIANDGVHAQRAVGGRRVGGDLRPDQRAVVAAESEQVVLDVSVRSQLIEELLACVRIDEACGVERLDVVLAGRGRRRQHRSQVRVRGERDGTAPHRTVVRGCLDLADVNAFVDRFEQPRNSLSAFVHGQIIRVSAGEIGRRGN